MTPGPCETPNADFLIFLYESYGPRFVVEAWSLNMKSDGSFEDWHRVASPTKALMRRMPKSSPGPSPRNPISKLGL